MAAKSFTIQKKEVTHHTPAPLRGWCAWWVSFWRKKRRWTGVAEEAELVEEAS
jgi:hypothetical protein